MPLFNDGDTDFPDIGARAEAMFLLWLHTRDDVIHDQIRDVRKDKSWQRREVDFIVPYIDGTWENFEAKGDNRASDTGRLYTEFARVYRGKDGTGHILKPGWNFFTHAGRVVVWVEPEKTFYLYRPVEMLLAWHKMALTGVYPQRYRSDENCATWSLYVPKTFIDGLEAVYFEPNDARETTYHDAR